MDKQTEVLKTPKLALIQNEGDKVKVSVVTIESGDKINVYDTLFTSTVRAIGWVDSQKMPFVITGGQGVQSRRRGKKEH